MTHFLSFLYFFIDILPPGLYYRLQNIMEHGVNFDRSVEMTIQGIRF